MQTQSWITSWKHLDFTDRLKNIVTKEYLQKVCEKYQAEKGYFSTREVVAVFKRPASVVIIWKQYFTEAKGEFVAEMVLVKVDGQYKCDHVMFEIPPPLNSALYHRKNQQ